MPIFHHANRQKTPAGLVVGNYTQYFGGAYSSYNTMVQNGSTLRVYYNNTTIVGGQYPNNGYFVYNTAIPTNTDVTITGKFSWNAVNHGGWIGLAMRDSSRQHMYGIYSISYPGYAYRTIMFDAPGGSYLGGIVDGGTGGLTVGQNFWLRVARSSSAGTITFSRSLDGSTFTTHHTANLAAFVEGNSLDGWGLVMVPGTANNTQADVTVHEITIA